MLLTGMLIGYAVGITAYAVSEARKRRKCERAYDERCDDYISALDSVGQLSHSLDVCNGNVARCQLKIKALCDLAQNGWKNLQVRQYKNHIDVVGVSVDCDAMFFVVKSFPFENDADKEFALRQAEDLMETIQRF